MKIISNKKKLAEFVDNEKNLGFVPTMGAIHSGHASLINKSIASCSKTIVSIFINKPQFNKKIDYKNYPRKRIKDILALRKLKIDYLYLPTSKQIYPSGHNKNIKISSFSKKLCGKNRPGHFKSVVDVVQRFIKIIKPAKIFLGEKDMQQLKIIDHFIKKNHIKTKVIGCKTIREKNGVACSSRNFLLSNQEMKFASSIYKYISKNKKKLIKGKIQIKNLRSKIIKLGADKIDYFELININKIIKPYKSKKKYKIFVAYFLGKTRLIDNI